MKIELNEKKARIDYKNFLKIIIYFDHRNICIFVGGVSIDIDTRGKKKEIKSERGGEEK